MQKGIYQHYKGNYYEVIDVARHSETLEMLVVYRALYGDFGLWVRPLQMFLERVEVVNIKKPRFDFITEQSGDELLRNNLINPQHYLK